MGKGSSQSSVIGSGGGNTYRKTSRAEPPPKNTSDFGILKIHRSKASNFKERFQPLVFEGVHVKWKPHRFHQFAATVMYQ